MAKQFGFVCLALGLLVIFADTSNAQYGLIQRSNRALGHWNGPGYHRCNPGPDSSYYNAWSQKNSFLISRSPQYLSRYRQDAFPTPMQLLYSGQSAYGQPPAMAQPGMYHSAVPMNADFVPSQRNRRDADDAEDRGFQADDASDRADEKFVEDENDFNTGSEGIEDRFDAEVDEMDDGFDEPGEFEKDSDVQDSPSDNVDDKDASVLSTPGSLFLPAGHVGSGR